MTGNERIGTPWFDGRGALILFNNVPLRTRRALLSQTLYSDSALLVLNGTSMTTRGGSRGAQRLYARTHITSAKSEVLFGRDPGPA